MTKLEKIQDLLTDVETDIRKATVADILIDLRDSLKHCSDAELAGLTAAIETIESNY